MRHGTQGESDEALVARCRAGDAGAFGLLFARHHAKIFGLAVRILTDRESALDAVQETFVRACRSLDGYTGEGSFSGWLARITANLGVDGIRSRHRGERVAAQAESAQLMEVPAHDDRPDQTAEAAELRRALEAARAKLSPMHRPLCQDE